ncbi:MAG: bifunctional phosphopantothenoylcysteine decarboxylase/phosphopantothenate--cysteine ligase CoaBC [Fibrobacter sp.]|nr:bifunctional phosphopantothenoylcysteine decarboxylase/phosphopantothenate--cysteine ligase CoaBC [Fibrobacter sp.]
MDLKGKKILLGVSGGIAAYKSCELLRLLQKKGAEVRVCMTEAATQFVAPLTFASLSKCPVYLKNGAAEARPFQHIDFPRWADLYLVVPATANVIGKFAFGIADDPVSLCFMSCDCERFIAPAMNVAMYNSPAVKRNLEMLRGFEKTHVLESPAGFLACGEVGQGRLLEPAQIVECLEAAEEIAPKCHCENSQSSKQSKTNLPEDLIEKNGRRVLITAGRTEEAIDPVRYISNCSSGKTAVALSAVFLANGYDVEVVAGPMEAQFPGGVKVTKVRSACQMHDAVLERQPDVDVLVHCAAVADYRPANPADSKIKDSRSQLTIELVPNPNILRDCSAARREGRVTRKQVIVGFALETDHFKEHAAEKFEKSGADALLLNAPVAADSGFGHDNVRYALIEHGKPIPELNMGSKVSLAESIVNFCSAQFSQDANLQSAK